MNQSKFNEAARIITANFEGGYFHHNMFLDGRMNKKDQHIYRNSGETMFGIDRKAGAGLRALNQTAWDTFWRMIDNSGAANRWKYNSRGGNLERQLQDLTGEIMLPVYLDYAGRYLTESARKAVETDPALFLHFAYGAWNGPGWFQRYAGVTNAGVKAGKSISQLRNDAVNYRKNSGNPVIIRTGQKLGAYIASNYPLKGSGTGSGSLPLILAAAAALFF